MCVSLAGWRVRGDVRTVRQTTTRGSREGKLEKKLLNSRLALASPPDYFEAAIASPFLRQSPVDDIDGHCCQHWDNRKSTLSGVKS